MKRTIFAVAMVAGLAGIFAAADGGAQGTLPTKGVMRVTALANGEAELIIYGFIGETWFGEGNIASSIVQQLGQISATTIQVRINSPGGSVPDGLAIYNALRRHPARKVVTVDGEACSIASLLVQAGDERIMPDNTLQMMHAPSTVVSGNALELREYADQLDTWASTIKATYLGKAPTKERELQAMLTDGKDHYFTAEEAVAFGLADTVLSSAPAPAPDAAAAAAALLGYIDAITKAPAPIAARLRRHIASAAQPQIFASLPEANQRAVLAHIEDPTMRANLLSLIVANAAGAAGAQPAAGAAPTPAPTPAPAPTAAAPAAAAPAGAGADPIAAIEERNTRIRAVFENFREAEGIRELEASCLANPRLTVEAAQQTLLNRLGGRAAPARPTGGTNTNVEAGVDEADRLREAGVQWLMARSGLLPREEDQRARQGNPYLNCTLVTMAERALIRAGVDTRSLDREQLVIRAMHPNVVSAQTTSDFPILLENTLNKVLQAGYKLTAFTWQRWCATGSVPDFKVNPRYHLGSFSDLKTTNEAGEYEQGVLSDGDKESIQAKRKGRIMVVTPEVLINDDMNAFTRPILVLGQAAGRTIEKDALALLASNPTMSDNVALFHASHGNLIDTGSGTAPTVAAFDAMRQLLGSQKEPGGNDYIDITPAVWLGPLSLGTQARTTNTSEYNPDVSQKYAPPNTSRGMVRDVVDSPRLTGTAWYLFADANSEPVIEVAFLNGQTNPTIEQEVNFKTDGLAWKVVHRYATGAVGWRGAAKNAGA